jgi:hypothetical protein
MTDLVFSVQDDTGTVYQLETVASPNAVVNVGDVGLYTGIPDNGTDAKVIPAEISQPFTVTQVLDATHFSITSRPDTLTTGWPRSGVIDWVTGGNISIPTTIVRIEAANAYTTIDEVKRYLASRGRDLGAFTDVQTQAAIVDASDYIDQRYVFKGVKRTQKFGTNVGPQNGVFVEPWLSPRAWGVVGSNILVPSTTPQETQWPRQGAVDRNGDTINGLPTAVKHACAELVYRVAKGNRAPAGLRSDDRHPGRRARLQDGEGRPDRASIQLRHQARPRFLPDHPTGHAHAVQGRPPVPERRRKHHSLNASCP